MPKPPTPMSRFHIHDDLSAPEDSLPILRGALSTAGQLPNFIGVLAGSPAALRAYARFRSELRHGTLAAPTLERISLAVAQHYDSQPGLALHLRTARHAGLSVDEIALAREWDSHDEREALLLSYLSSLVARQAQRVHPKLVRARVRLERAHSVCAQHVLEHVSQAALSE